MLRVAINGYGRIGRNVHRQFVENFSDDVEVVAVNASSNAEMRAYLLKYDSLHGKAKYPIEVDGDHLNVNGKPVHVVKERDPAKCPWKELKVDIVVESSGNFTTREKAEGHLIAGARKVIVTAPMKDDTPTFVKGVNDELLTADIDMFSNGSCTTNCIAPIIKVIDRAYGIDRLLVGSVHAFTVSQNLLDNKPKDEDGGGFVDYRRARAATLSIIPTKTGAVKACAKIFPHLKGKLDGMAFRVPVPTVSCAYMAFSVGKDVTTEEVNEVLIAAAADPSMKGVLSVTHEHLVSIDLQTDPHSSIVDAHFTKVVDNRGIQILSWYDNEWGYAMRVTEMVVQWGSL